MSEACIWEKDEYGAFDTSCEGKFEFMNDGVKENQFNYCPYCGERIYEEDNNGNE